MTSDSARVLASKFRPGQTFAERYKIRRLLSSDAVSFAFEADDLPSERYVALKIVRAVLGERKQEAFTQYRLDLNRMRQITHEHIVRVFDCGEFAGHYYVAMELIEGTRLREYVGSRRPIPLSEFFNLLHQLSDALIQLHRGDIVHRDLHPGNIVITSTGILKVLDFAADRDRKYLAKAVLPSAHEFAAPEQTQGRPATFSMDIYSLGAIGSFLLNGNAPGAIAATLERCLQIDPAKRYQSVAEFVSDLTAAAHDAQNPNVARADARGVQLSSLQKDVPEKTDKCLWVALKIVARLREIHAAGQFHSELAPERIWLRGETIEIEQAPPVTGKGTLLIQEPRYSAPELLLAMTTPDQASHTAADIYVLGFVLYELLAGRVRVAEQIPGLTAVSAGLGWMRWHADPQQKLQPLVQIVPDCPGALSDLVERMIEKDAAKRIRDLDKLESELKALTFRLQQTDHFATSPVDIPAPVAPPVIASKTGRSRLLPIIAALVLFSALVMGPWFWTNRGWRTLWPTKTPAASSNPAGRAASTAAYPQMAETATGLMLLIPEGEFTMGDDSLPIAAPAHKVALTAFYLDRLEVTNRRYRAFCQRAIRALPPNPAWDSGYLRKGDYPVINVTWDDAQAFCEFSGERLPSEAEWEKAARGVEPFIHWANWTLPGLANLAGVAAHQPSAVGSFPGDVSPYGVLDMAGNVQEWVSDSYRPYRKSPFGHSSRGDGRKLIRGGSYAMIPEGLSPAWRGWVAEGSGPAQSPLVGFRCAADPATIISGAR